jgi:hypothetical protein
MDLSVDRSLAIGSFITTVVLLVLDKAGKLKGPLLLILLGAALCMTIPILFSIPWVVHTQPGLPILAKRMLMIFLVGVVWASLSVWITSGDVKASEVIGQSHTQTNITEKQKLCLELIPHGINSPDLFLEVINNGEPTELTAKIRILSRSYGDGVKGYAFDGLWDGPAFSVSSRRRIPTQGGRTSVHVKTGDNALLRIASMRPELAHGQSIMDLVNIKEKLMWDFEQKPNSDLPFFTLQIQLLAEGFLKPKPKIYKVGPTHAYGPIGMTEVPA